MKNLLLVFLLIGPFVLAFSQQNNQKDTLSAYELQEVVVSTQRTASYLHQTPAAIERLSGKAISARQSRTTPEALMTMPGVFVQKTNHGGGSAFLRGLTGNQTLLLIDGIRLSNATFRYGPNQYLNTIDPFTIQRVEVWKGGGSVPFGSDALGGTINILLQDTDILPIDNKPHLNLSTQWRSQDMEQSARLQAGIAAKKIAVLAGATLRSFGDLAGGKDTGIQSPSGYDEYAYDFKGKWQIAENIKLSLAHQFFRQTDVPIYHKIQLENFALNHISLQQRHLSYARLGWVPKARWLQEVTATVSLQQTEEHRDIRKNGSATLRAEADKVSTWGASLLAVAKPLQFWRGTAGLEYYNDAVGSTREDTDTGTNISVAKRGLYPDGSTYANFALFCTNEWEVGAWNFSGGVRYNLFGITLYDETLGDVNLSPSAFVYNAGIMRRISKRDKLFFDYNSSFRAPNIDDLGSLGIVDFRYEVPTKDLKPEKSGNFELGWRHTSARFQAAAFVFNNQLHDLITRVQVIGDSIAGYPVYRKENVEKGYIRGVEADVRFLLGAKWQVEGAMAWQYGQNLTQNEPLRRIPPVFGHLGLSYQTQGWQTSLELLAAGKQSRLAAGDKADNRIPAGGTPGWWVVNCYGQYTWKWLALRAGLHNIFNADYRYHGSGINAPGRHISASLVLSL